MSLHGLVVRAGDRIVRNAFAEELTRLAAHDERIVLLFQDIDNPLFNRFREQFPRRFYQGRGAEQSLIGVAAGLAMSGFRPVLYNKARLTAAQCYEQLRVDLCYRRAPVLVIGGESGLSCAELGPAHHALDDYAIMRVLPDMTVLAPCDEFELQAALRSALRLSGPAYIRISHDVERKVHDEPPRFSIGHAITLSRGHDICLVAAGTIVATAYVAAEMLRGHGFSVGVVSMPSIKPLDTACLSGIFASYRMVATIEEHSRIGGLGSAVAEWRTEAPDARAHHIIFGADDRFLHESGPQESARRVSGLAAESIVLGCSARLGTCIEI
jgi:transketolase